MEAGALRRLPPHQVASTRRLTLVVLPAEVAVDRIPERLGESGPPPMTYAAGGSGSVTTKRLSNTPSVSVLHRLRVECQEEVIPVVTSADAASADQEPRSHQRLGFCERLR